MSTKTMLAILAASACLTGCYKAQIVLKDRPSRVSKTVDGKLHYSVFRVLELSSPVDLERACEKEATKIEDGVSLYGTLVNAVLGSVLPPVRVMTPTVHCATE